MNKEKLPGLFNWDKIEILKVEDKDWSLKGTYVYTKSMFALGHQTYVSEYTLTIGKYRITFKVKDPSIVSYKSTNK